MTHCKRLSILVLSIIVIAFTTPALAEKAKVEGLIKARNGPTMLLQTNEGASLTVLLDDDTEVGQVEGVFKARRKDMSMTSLIPGLAVKVEGTYNQKNELQASLVKFKGSDLKRAKSIQAGLHESQEAIKKQQQELQAQQAQIAEQQAKISANKAAIDAAVARFGQLDDYYIFDEVTVYFGNGKTKVDPQFVPQLLALSQKAKNIEGFMIEIVGYASSQGSTELNQKLSEDRADNVSHILLQQGNIPLTRMLAPGAMGESRQIGNENSKQAQAENRRVVVRVLQNKAIARM